VLPAEHSRESLAGSIAIFAEIIATADLTIEVPSCPGWDLAALTRHLGSVHRWATQAVVSGERPEQSRTDDGPVNHDELGAWFADGARDLQHALTQVDPQRHTWTFGPPPQIAAFWSRRQAHETLIHAWDATASIGQSLRIDPVMAIDGLDEIASVMFPRQVQMGRTQPLVHSLAVVPDELPEAGIVLAGDGTNPPLSCDAVMHGPAADLLLVLWGRLPADSVDINGDRDAAMAVLDAAISP
jgi:uncharacterized protein (TIGR03083 family)